MVNINIPKLSLVEAIGMRPDFYPQMIDAIEKDVSENKKITDKDLETLIQLARLAIELARKDS